MASKKEVILEVLMVIESPEVLFKRQRESDYSLSLMKSPYYVFIMSFFSRAFKNEKEKVRLKEDLLRELNRYMLTVSGVAIPSGTPEEILAGWCDDDHRWVLHNEDDTYELTNYSNRVFDYVDSSEQQFNEYKAEELWHTVLDKTSELAAELVTDKSSRIAYHMRIMEGLKKQMEKQQELESLEKEIEGGNQRMEMLQRERNEARDALMKNGGGRQEMLQKKINDLSRELTQRTNVKNRLNTRLNQVGLSEVNSKEEFYHTIQLLPKKMEMEAETRGLDNEKEQMAVELHQKQQELSGVSSQVKELEKHPNTNIPSDYVALRYKMCEELGVQPMKLPYAGELMQVKQSAKSQGWEGALERLLRPFSMTLLVESSLYEKVSNWVDAFKKSNKSLKIKFMKASTNMYEVAQRANDRKMRAYDCISVKEEHPLANWITDHLIRRFDFVCCDTMGAFRNEKFALTKSGLIKKKNYHEKVVYGKNQQPEQFVMGYSNKIHLEQLKERERNLFALVERISAKKQAVQEKREDLEKKQNIVFSIISNNRDYNALDVETVNRDLINAENELKELEKKDPENKRLKEILDRTDKEIKGLLVKMAQLNASKGAKDMICEMYERDTQAGEKAVQVLDSMVGIRKSLWQTSIWMKSRKINGRPPKICCMKTDITGSKTT